MSAVQFFLPHQTATVAGIALPGARFEFLATGTTTPLSVYSDAAMTVERTNPVVCNGAGALPTTYCDNTKTYRLRIYDKHGTLIEGGDIDPYIPGTIPAAAVLQPYQDAAQAAAASSGSSASAAASSATAAATSAGQAATSATAAQTARTGAEAAQSGTIAALSGTSLASANIAVATRVLLAAADHTNGLPAILTEPGYQGVFVWNGANLQTQVAADTHTIYVPPTGGNGSTGAWVRVPVQAQSSVISLAASASGASPNIGLTINMPASGTKQDVGVKVVGGTGAGSGKMLVLEKNRSGGEDFFRALEYAAGGQYYVDAGTVSATHAVSLRINSGAAIESRKSILISGTVKLNGTPADPADPAHAPVFVQPNLNFNMLGIYADGDNCISTRVTDSSPDNPNNNQIHWSMVGFGGAEVRVIWKNGDIGFMDNYVPTENRGLDRRTKELFTWGRVGKRGCGPLNNVTVDKRGVSCVTAFTVAEINGKGPDAYIHPNALINCTDATLPGLYMSNGFQFVHVADATKIIGPDSFGWTPAYFDQSGGVIAASGTGNKTFAKTAGIADWVDAAYATTTITGDQLIEFTINDSTAADTYMVGFASAVPTASPAYGPTQGNLYGAYKPGSMNVRSVLAGVAGGTNYATVAVGDIIGIRLVYSGSNGTLTLEQNRSTVATLSTTVPLVALRPMVTFNQVNGSIANFRWRSL